MNSRQDLYNIDPYLFEVLVANLWQAKGYTTDVRSKSKDRGVDIEAKKAGYMEVIQAKRYNSNNKISSKTVREYATLYQQIPTANTVVIVTSGSFTDEAKQLANDLKVDIFNGDQVHRQMDKYDVEIDSINSNQQIKNSGGSQSTTGGSSDESVETHTELPQKRTSDIRVEVLSIVEGNRVADFSTNSADELVERLDTGDLSDRVGIILSVTCLGSQFTFNTHKISFLSEDGYEYQNTGGLFTGYFGSSLDKRFSGYDAKLSYKQTKNYLCVSDQIPEGVCITGISYDHDFSFSIDFSDQRRELLETNSELKL